MKYMVLKSLLLCLAITAVSCSDDDTDTTLLLYEHDGVTIVLDAVEEGRCPKNHICIWEGNAQIQLTISDGADSKEFFLHSAGLHGHEASFPHIVQVMGHEVELLTIEPCPEDVDPIPLEEYSIDIIVRN